MSPVAFDTLPFARRLTESGVPQEQAEAHGQALAAAVSEQLVTREDLRKALEPLATKEDLRALDMRLTARIDDLDDRLTGKIEDLERRMVDLERRIDVGLHSLETRLTIRFGTIVVAALGVMSALNRLL
jgi:hypothetical protein